MNRVRVFSEVVSIDAWHDPIVNGRTAGVYVELAFREGRMGGDEEDFPFTFKVALKRAELLVTVEPPLEIIKRSIARAPSGIEIQRTATTTASRSKKGETGASLTWSNEAPKAGAALSVAATSSKVGVDVLQISEKPAVIMVASSPHKEGSYRWVLEPSYLNHLVGQPWHPVSERRFDVRTASTNSGIEPAVRAELACRLEDLTVSDIVPKNPTLADRVQKLVKSDVRRKAAEHHIKHVLRSANLEVGRMDDRFSSLLLATVLASLEGGK